jgi:hypothetical protein
MPNRIVKIYGYGVGSSTATINVSVEGTEIFSGAVTTSTQELPALPDLSIVDNTVELCSFEIPIDFSGQKAMSCEVTNGTVIFAQIEANYCKIPNPIFSSSEWAVLSNVGSTNGSGSTGFSNIYYGESRSEIQINGVTQPIVHSEEYTGTFWWIVPAGSTLSYNLNVASGQE